MDVVTFNAASPRTEEDGERSLVAAARRGDRDAAGQLLESCYQGVYASLCRMCGADRELAADLTQETFRKCWSSLSDFDGRARFATWLYRIAYTTFLNHIRRPNRVSPLDERMAEPSDPAPRADALLQSQQDHLRLRRAVLELGDDLRLTVTAHFWGELPVREIAEMQGVTTVAIRKRLERAYRLLEQKLKDLR